MLNDSGPSNVLLQLTWQRLWQTLQAALQTLFFKADTAKAFTTVLAGLALTFISWPNIKRLPAFVAALCFVLIMQTPGIVNLPVPFTSLPASVAKASKTFATSDFFCSPAVANASAMAPFGIALTPAFIAFIAFIAFLAIDADRLLEEEALVSQQG